MKRSLEGWKVTNVLQSLSNVVTVLANGAAGGPGGSHRSQAGRVVLREVDPLQVAPKTLSKTLDAHNF
jgi:hypothetical protein